MIFDSRFRKTLGEMRLASGYYKSNAQAKFFYRKSIPLVSLQSITGPATGYINAILNSSKTLSENDNKFLRLMFDHTEGGRAAQYAIISIDRVLECGIVRSFTSSQQNIEFNISIYFHNEMNKYDNKTRTRYNYLTPLQNDLLYERIREKEKTNKRLFSVDKTTAELGDLYCFDTYKSNIGSHIYLFVDDEYNCIKMTESGYGSRLSSHEITENSMLIKPNNVRIISSYKTKKEIRIYSVKQETLSISGTRRFRVVKKRNHKIVDEFYGIESDRTKVKKRRKIIFLNRNI